MAEEAGCMDLYNGAYAPFSIAAHSMWPHVRRYDLQFCSNVLHKIHLVPLIEENRPPCFEGLVVSAKYVQKIFLQFNHHFKLRITVPYPRDYLVNQINKMKLNYDNGCIYN